MHSAIIKRCSGQTAAQGPEPRPEAPTNGKANPQLSSCGLGTTVLPGIS